MGKLKSEVMIPKASVSVIRGPEKRALNVLELAQYLGMKPWHAEEELRKGKIKFKWVGDHRVVDRKDADEYFESLPYAKVEIKDEEKNRGVDIGTSKNGVRASRQRKLRYVMLKKVGNTVVVGIR